MLEDVPKDPEAPVAVEPGQDVEGVADVDPVVELAVVVGDAASEGFDALDLDLPLVGQNPIEPEFTELPQDHSPSAEANADVDNALRLNLHDRLDAPRDVMPVTRTHL